MSDKIGYVGYQESESGNFYSKETHKKLDDEIKNLVDSATETVRKIIKERTVEITKLSEVLLEKETLNLKQIREILGDRPFEDKDNFKIYFDEVEKNEEEKEEKEN